MEQRERSPSGPETAQANEKPLPGKLAKKNHRPMKLLFSFWAGAVFMILTASCRPEALPQGNSPSALSRQTKREPQKSHPPESSLPRLRRAQGAGIYSRHWFGRLPHPASKKNPLLIHDIFIISFDTEKKLPFWIAYHLSPALVWGDLKAARKYIPDPLLSPGQSLKIQDYKGSSRCDGKGAGYDKGHLAPVGSFKASPHIYQAQYLSNIAPQTRKLNQGPWRALEEQVRAFVKKGNVVRILTGPLYGREGKNKTPPCWKAAQGRLREIPHSYWKIIAFKRKSKISACAFLMPQETKKSQKPQKHMVKWRQIERETGLKLFAGLKRPVIANCDFLFD